MPSSILVSASRMPRPLRVGGAAPGRRRARCRGRAPRRGHRRAPRGCRSRCSGRGPVSALVEGVNTGSGSRSLSRRPAGSAHAGHGAGALVVEPAAAREVATHDELGRQRRRPPADHDPAAQLVRRPRAHAAGSVAGSGAQQVVGHDGRRVRPNQKRDRPVSTRPLSGTGVGSTTSNAEMRSDATSSSRSSSSAYRSRTLPERRNERVGPSSTHRPAPARSSRARMVAAWRSAQLVVEARGQLVGRQRRGDLRIGRDQRRGTAAARRRRAARVRWTIDVGVLARQAAVLDQRREQPAATRGGPGHARCSRASGPGRTTSPSTRPRNRTSM